MQKLSDDGQRTAALDTGRSHYVESPAGSGKTLLLTKRFLKLLGSVKDPAEILAITFTEKAAGEMRQRITGFLSGRASANDPDGEMTALAEKALRAHKDKAHLLTSSDALNIMTFHGFCSHIARRAPLEAGVAPDFEIIDDDAQAILIEEIVRGALKDFFVYPQDDGRRVAFENRLLHHNNNWNGISGEFRDIIKNRGRFRDLTDIIRQAGGRGISKLPSILRERLRGYVEKRLHDLSSIFTETELGSRWVDFTNHLSEQGAATGTALPSHLPEYLWEELPSWQTIANTLTTKAGTALKKFGPANGFYNKFSKTEWGVMITSMGEPCAAALAEIKILPSPHDIDSDMDVLSDFIITAADLIDRYETACMQRRVLDFAGLEQAALRALNDSDPSEIQLYLDHRIQHLLVDEFQDTNRIQWELVRRICSGWVPGDGRTVFIVGDPKQSIYSFRNAEVRLFIEAKSGIPIPGGDLLPLDAHLLKTNFRSVKKLIEWTNSLFGETVMKEPDADADEVPFGPSETAAGKENGGAISLSLFADSDIEKARDNEAAWLAGKVGEVMKETGEDRSIAILLFTRNRISRYLQAFKNEGIPLQVREGLSLARRPEVMHLIKIAELMATPHNDLAWASILRSPWSWFDTNLLYETARQEPESWMGKILLTAQLHPDMEKLTNAIDNASRRVGRDSLGTTVRRFWEDLDGPRRTASMYGMAGVANCLQFLEILEDARQGTPLNDLYYVKATISSRYEPADPAASRSPVQMMTIHKAKGLEFDIVFLPFMDWKPLSGGSGALPPYLLERIPGAAGEHVVAIGRDRRSKQSPPVYELLKKFQKNRRWGEAKRLFYVAATRAKETLFMSGIAKLKDDDILTAGKGNILEWVMEHEGIDGADINSVPAGKNIAVGINPVPLHMPPDGTKDKPVLPEPYALSPERPAYTMAKSPSSMVDDALLAEETLSDDEALFNRMRGTVIHNILSTAISGRPLPATPAVASALYAGGAPKDLSKETAAGILEEAGKTLADPFITRLLESPETKSEWEIEDMPGEKRVRSGIIDLAALDGDTWWICDFKTSRPEDGQPVEEFIAHEKELYRPQLETYHEMLANLKNVPKSQIRTGIYLTALQRWEELL
ncbi:MAG: UvrD-helicase domain-containing protein [Deltaproteobacteria bacterium]|nr:UvrD-helicase domain-containing protein [Deltaproteobacteria bacterium]